MTIIINVCKILYKPFPNYVTFHYSLPFYNDSSAMFAIKRLSTTKSKCFENGLCYLVYLIIYGENLEKYKEKKITFLSFYGKY